MARILIQICPAEPATSVCLPDGREIAHDHGAFDALSDCNAGGDDIQPACEFVRDTIGVDWRIVARDAAGNYENRAATAAEKEATARAIYFESDSDFADEATAEMYLIWDAARELEQAA